MVESATYRVTSLAVPRDRPHVHRLEDLPADASYPSGHTAAAIAVYAGLVLLLTSRFPTRALRVCAWAVAIVIPVLVALARMYRGMHHPLDAAGGPRHRDRGTARAAVRHPRGGRGKRNAAPGRQARPRSSAPGGRMKVAVVAHAAKMLDGGLPELRRVLETEGVDKPLWYEVPKAKKASEQVQRALDEGAELVFAWGGDGTVRRCVDTLAGTDASLAVVPAGTANLFATNLGIPTDIEGCGRSRPSRTIAVSSTSGASKRSASP